MDCLVVCSALAFVVAPVSVVGCENSVESCDGVIAFSSAQEGNPEIYLMHLDGTGLTRLTHRDERDGYPVCSPDGKKVAFYAYEDSTTWSINVMDIDGGNRTRLTNQEGARDAGPAWSIGGSSIAFTRGRNEEYELWVMDADGSNQRRFGNLEGFAPQWSTDGSKIIFNSFRNDTVGLYIMNPDGSGERHLTPFSDYVMQVSWCSKPEQW